MKVEKPQRISRSYTQSLGAPPERIFPLLCPVREADWVPDWNPELILSNCGVAEAECVFRTPDSPDNAIWIITQFDPENYALEMYKVRPNHTVGKLEIALVSDGPGATKADIAYTYTAIGPVGEAFLSDFTEEWYLDFMVQWEKALNHYLSTGEKIS